MTSRSPKIINIDLEDDTSRAFVLFVQTSDAVQKYADARLYKAGLSIIKWMVLKTLDFNGGIMTPSAIAEWTLRERHNITTLIRRMRKDGLIITEPHSTDRRSINVILTDRGREVLAQTLPVAKEIINQVMTSMAGDDTLSMEKSLRVLRQNALNGLEQVTKRSYPLRE